MLKGGGLTGEQELVEVRVVLAIAAATVLCEQIAESLLDMMAVQLAVEVLEVQQVPDLEGLMRPGCLPELVTCRIERIDFLGGAVELVGAEVIVVIDEPDLVKRDVVFPGSVGVFDRRCHQAGGVLALAVDRDLDLLGDGEGLEVADLGHRALADDEEAAVRVSGRRTAAATAPSGWETIEAGHGQSFLVSASPRSALRLPKKGMAPYLPCK